MTEIEITSILEKCGWSCKPDEVGDHFCVLDFGDKMIRIFPTIRKRSDHLRVTFMPSISCKPFSQAVSRIFGENIEYEPIVVRNSPPRKMLELSTGDVLGLAEEAISWADAESLESGLAIYRSLPTDAKGAMPLRHLAALAMAREVDILVSYRDSFERGNRLGFVLYVTTEMLDRAILIAREK
ncbi:MULTISPECIES: DUF6990 domain-containing protein [Achromobacter]|uniref:DUF6990 domain-containing protein n=1 Tax=Achromobacter TaxID=222 RepID=UPI001581F604|nr:MULTISPECIES: hypothetical protein [Achromobacter]MBD9429901.1 hypothetical protein [Achromobacter sp. ACM03]